MTIGLKKSMTRRAVFASDSTSNQVLNAPTLCCALAIALGCVTDSWTQESDGKTASKKEPTAAKSGLNVTPDAQLTDGLLDLLDAPESPASMQGAEKRIDRMTPADLGLNREDLVEQAANPLLAVQQSMLIAAGFLQRGATGKETQALQQDIVQRLDEFIEQMEQSNSSASQTSQSPPQADSSTTQERRSSSASAKTQSPANGGEEPEDRKSDSEGESSQSPGQRGVAASGTVRLNDPQALQQNVWGHLPQRIRTQMQSRMVEQFLPSYREQLEAYYKALLEADQP